jgi:hypothetical protein
MRLTVRGKPATSALRQSRPIDESPTRSARCPITSIRRQGRIDEKGHLRTRQNDLREYQRWSESLGSLPFASRHRRASPLPLTTGDLDLGTLQTLATAGSGRMVAQLARGTEGPAASRGNGSARRGDA